MSKKEITEETLSEQKNLPDFSINSSVIKTVDDSSAQTKQPTARADGKFPQISIDSNNFDFGEVYEGENIIHSFKVKNTGSSVLTIKNVKPGWGCTVASFPKAIPPGQEGTITLKLDTKNMSGKLLKAATILSNDPETPKTVIVLSAKVKPFISVQPGIKITLQGYYGDVIKKKLTITSFEDLPFEITEVKSGIDDKIKYTLNKLREPEKYSLDISTAGGIKESFRGKISLKTNSKKKPVVELYILGRLKSKARVVPSYVYFGIIDTSSESLDPKSLERKVEVKKTMGQSLSIEKVESTAGWIIPEIDKNKKDGDYSVVIKLNKDGLPKGNFREKVLIHTKCDGRSETGFVIIEGKVK